MQAFASDSYLLWKDIKCRKSVHIISCSTVHESMLVHREQDEGKEAKGEKEEWKSEKCKFFGWASKSIYMRTKGILHDILSPSPLKYIGAIVYDVCLCVCFIILLFVNLILVGNGIDRCRIYPLALLELLFISLSLGDCVKIQMHSRNFCNEIPFFHIIGRCICVHLGNIMIFVYIFRCSFSIFQGNKSQFLFFSLEKHTFSIDPCSSHGNK